MIGWQYILNDKDMVLAAISQSRNAILYASENLKNDKDIVLRAMSRS